MVEPGPDPSAGDPDVKDVSKKDLKKSAAGLSTLDLDVDLKELHAFGANNVKSGGDFGSRVGKFVDSLVDDPTKKGGIDLFVQDVADAASAFPELANFAKSLGTDTTDLKTFTTDMGKGLTAYGNAALDAFHRYDAEDQKGRDELDRVDFEKVISNINDGTQQPKVFSRPDAA